MLFKAYPIRFYKFILQCAALSFRILPVLFLTISSSAERLPVKIYNVSDGLAHPRVSSIYQDAKGYLWFGTWEGLSRFDGYGFVNYGMRDGLGQTVVNCVAADRQGRLWAATNGGGVSRLVDNPQESPGKKFVSFAVGDSIISNRVNWIFFDAENNFWAGTDAGIYRAVASANLQFEAVIGGQSQNSHAFFEESPGHLWFGLVNELIEFNRRQIINHGAFPSDKADNITSILKNRAGNLLISGRLGGLAEFSQPTQNGQTGEWRTSSLPLKEERSIEFLFEDSSGSVWLGGSGLFKYKDGQLTEYTTAQGLSGNTVISMAEDRDGNLWVGTSGGGASKFGGELIVNYPLAAGTESVAAYGIFETDEDIKIMVESGEAVTIAAGKISRPDSFEYPPFFRVSTAILRNRQGVWRSGQGEGFGKFRRPVLHLRRSGREFPLADFFASEKDFSDGILFYEDEAGKLWFAKPDGNLYRADPAQTGRIVFEKFPIEAAPMREMVGDRSGGIWLITARLSSDGIARLGRLKDGQYTRFAPVEGLREIDPRSIFLDSRGWLWIGMRYGGVSMTRNPTAEQPVFVNFNTENGLSSNTGWAIAEDDAGRIYVGTGRGLNRFDPNANRWQIFTAKDGLAGDIVNNLFKDRQGNIWVSTLSGVSKFNPHAERQAENAAPIFLSRINVAGEDLPLAETGAAAVAPLEFSASDNNLTIDFVALQFHGEDNLTYQYRLEGDRADWSVPTKTRSVQFARLAPGDYRFEVRALTQTGLPSLQPAGFSFRILSPIYLRWWFIVGVLAVAIFLIYAFYRYRLNKLLEIERTRTRIATDLHDDIGANLSKISLLSDIVNMKMTDGSAESRRMLTTIAEVSRNSVDAMRDIVWAINPHRDSVLDMTRKMRQYAEETFVPKNIAVKFNTPKDNNRLKLSMDARRELFLIFKEAINNAARHSDCEQIVIVFSVSGGEIFLQITDDGRGFDVSREFDGNGLANMKTRAEKIGGRFEIETERESGTTIKIKI